MLGEWRKPGTERDGLEEGKAKGGKVDVEGELKRGECAVLVLVLEFGWGGRRANVGDCRTISCLQRQRR